LSLVRRVQLCLSPLVRYTPSGKPMQNGYVKSLNGRMRDELLNESLFFELDHAGELISAWVEDRNTAGPLFLGLPDDKDFSKA
jgi:transposase InsO family protein